MGCRYWNSGQLPDHTSERANLFRLLNSLKENPEEYFVFSNIELGNTEIDLLVFRENANFIVELKNIYGTLKPKLTGDWLLDGQVRPNYYKQVEGQFYALQKYLSDHAREFLSAARVESFFRGIPFKTFIAISGKVQLSENWDRKQKIEIIRFDNLPECLSAHCDSENNLTKEEIEKLAHSVFNLKEISIDSYWQPLTDLEGIDWAGYGRTIQKRLAEIQESFVELGGRIIDHRETTKPPKQIPFTSASILKTEGQVAIVGGSGIGKTYCLGRLTYLAASDFSSQTEKKDFAGKPIIIDLSSFRPDDDGLYELIRWGFKQDGLILSSTDIQALLHKDQQFLICLDNFDDLSEDLKEALKSQLGELSKIAPGVRLVVAIKPENERYFPNFTKAHLIPLDDRLVDRMIEKYSGTLPNSDFFILRERVRDFVGNLHPVYPLLVDAAIKYFQDHRESVGSNYELMTFLVNEQIKNMLKKRRKFSTALESDISELLREMAWDQEIAGTPYWPNVGFSSYIHRKIIPGGAENAPEIENMIRSLPFLSVARGQVHFAHDYYRKALATSHLLKRIDSLNEDEVLADFRKIDLLVFGLTGLVSPSPWVQAWVTTKKSSYFLGCVLNESPESPLGSAATARLKELGAEPTLENQGQAGRMIFISRNSPRGLATLLRMLSKEEETLRKKYRRELEEIASARAFGEGYTDLPVEILLSTTETHRSTTEAMRIDESDFETYDEIARILRLMQEEILNPQIMEITKSVRDYSLSARCYAGHLFAAIYDTLGDDRYWEYLAHNLDPRNEESAWVRDALWTAFTFKFEEIDAGDESSRKVANSIYYSFKDKMPESECFFPLNYARLFDVVENEQLIEYLPHDVQGERIFESIHIEAAKRGYEVSVIFELLEYFIDYCAEPSAARYEAFSASLNAYRCTLLDDGLGTVAFRRGAKGGMKISLLDLFEGPRHPLAILMTLLNRAVESVSGEAFDQCFRCLNQVDRPLLALVGMIGMHLMKDKIGTREILEAYDRHNSARTVAINELMVRHGRRIINTLVFLLFQVHGTTSGKNMGREYVNIFPPFETLKELFREIIKTEQSSEIFLDFFKVKTKYWDLGLTLLEDYLDDTRLKRRVIERIHTLEILPEERLIALIANHKISRA